MKRLTERGTNGTAMAACCGENCKYNFCCENSGFAECGDMDDIIDRLAAIEDILGDEYELEEIRKAIRCQDCEHMWAVSALPGECYCRLRGEVVPRDGYCHRGKAALKAREQDE